MCREVKVIRIYMTSSELLFVIETKLVFTCIHLYYSRKTGVFFCVFYIVCLCIYLSWGHWIKHRRCISAVAAMPMLETADCSVSEVLSVFLKETWNFPFACRHFASKELFGLVTIMRPNFTFPVFGSVLVKHCHKWALTHHFCPHQKKYLSKSH